MSKKEKKLKQLDEFENRVNTIINYDNDSHKRPDEDELRKLHNEMSMFIREIWGENAELTGHFSLLGIATNCVTGSRIIYSYPNVYDRCNWNNCRKNYLELIRLLRLHLKKYGLPKYKSPLRFESGPFKEFRKDFVFLCCIVLIAVGFIFHPLGEKCYNYLTDFYKSFSQPITTNSVPHK